MTKEHAEFIVETLTQLLSGQELVIVSIFGHKLLPEVRVQQRFETACAFETNGEYTVSLIDSYGVMTRAKEWNFDPDKRTVCAQTKNGFGQPLVFTWTVMDRSGESWRAFNTAMEKSWKFR